MRQRRPNLWVMVPLIALLTACSGASDSSPSATEKIVLTTENAAHGQPGTVWAWGENTEAELGTAQAGNVARNPVNVQDLTDVKALVNQGTSTFALRRDGTVWGWGGQVYEALARQSGTINILQAPDQVPGLANISAIFPSSTLGLDLWAVDDAGELWAWGPTMSSAQQIDLGPVRDIAGATSADRALLTDGTVWKLRGADDKPEQIMELTKITAVTSSAALTEDGQVWMTGFDGQTTPVAELTGVKRIFENGSDVDVVKADGSVWRWRQTTGHGQTPTLTQLAGVRDIVAVSPGSWAIDGDGAVWSIAMGAPPAKVAGLSEAVAVLRLVNGSSESVCVLDKQGNVWAWGNNAVGQLGLGDDKDHAEPAKLPLRNITAIVGGNLSAFALQG